MAARGKNKNQIVAALGRELLGFIGPAESEPNNSRSSRRRNLLECI
jgi:hypothetical protein